MFCCTNPDSDQCNLDYNEELARVESSSNNEPTETTNDSQATTIIKIAVIVACILCALISFLMVIGLFYQTKKRKQKYYESIKYRNDKLFETPIKGRLSASDEGLNDLEKIDSGRNSKQSLMHDENEDASVISSYKSGDADEINDEKKPN